MYGRLRSAWMRCASRIGISEREKLALWSSASAVRGGRPCLSSPVPPLGQPSWVFGLSLGAPQRARAYLTRSARLRRCCRCLASAATSSSRERVAWPRRRAPRLGWREVEVGEAVEGGNPLKGLAMRLMSALRAARRGGGRGMDVAKLPRLEGKCRNSIGGATFAVGSGELKLQVRIVRGSRC